MSEIAQQFIRLPQLSIRSHIRVGGPENALATRFDMYAPLELYLSDFGQDYLAGRVKQVRNSVQLLQAKIKASYSIIPTPTAQIAACAVRHSQRLLNDVQFEYRNAIVREIGARGGMHAKQLARIRARCNAHFDTLSPPIAAIDAYFAGHPEAIAAAANIADLWRQIADDRGAL